MKITTSDIKRYGMLAKLDQASKNKSSNTIKSIEQIKKSKLNSKMSIRNLSPEDREFMLKGRDNKEKSITETKLRIYKAYDAGYITESEKIEYLSVLEAVILKVDQYGLIPLPYKIGGVTVSLDSFDGKNTPESVQKDLEKYKKAINFVSKKYNSEILKTAIKKHLEYAEMVYDNWKDDPKAKTNANIQSYLKEADNVVKSKGKSSFTLFSIRMVDFDSYEFNFESNLMTRDGHGMVEEVDVKDGKLIISNYIDG